MGLFGAIDGQISGIGVEDVNTTGGLNVGGIVGFAHRDSRITAVSVSGSIKGQFTVGGIVGFTDMDCLIVNSSVNVNVVGNDSWIGGIVGTNYGAVINSSAKGNVAGRNYVGGLAGYSFGPITNSYAHSNAVAKTSVGGLVGYNHNRIEFEGGGFITNSYAGGSAEGVFHVGGLVGYNDGGTITDTYAIGNVVGSINVGGLVGSNNGTVAGVVAGSYGGGRVTAAGNVGNLVGNNAGTVTNELGTTPTLNYASGTHNNIRDDGEPSDSIGFITCGAEVRLPECGTPLPEQDQPGDIGALVLSELVFQESFRYILEPPFDPTKTSYELVSLANNSRGTYLSKATTNNPAAVITVKVGERTPINRVSSIPSDSPSIPGLSIGHNDLQTGNIEITVTAPDQTPKTYTIALPAQPDLTGIPSCQIDNNVLDIDKDNDGLIDICDIEGLYAIRYQLDGTAAYNDSAQNDRTMRGCPSGTCKGYELVKDLDFAKASSYRNNANRTVWTTSDKGWYPLGNFANPFNTEFNGNGHTISGLTINRNDSYDYVGLFGHIGADAEIKGLNLTNVNVAGRFNVGGLVGWNNQGVISDSYVSGTTTASEAWVGGMVGDSVGLIANSHADSTVSGDRIVGGLVGYHKRANTIINSYAMGDASGRSFVGGLVGLNEGPIANSYATGDVDDSIFYAGGLVGLNTDIIRNSYASGDVEGHTLVGGLTGDTRREISDSYASGSVQGQNLVGILTGSNSGEISYSYAIESEGLNLVGFQHDVGQTDDDSEEISVENIQSPSFNPQWSSDDWFFGNGQYPTVRYTAGDDPENPRCEIPPPDTAEPNCDAPLMGQSPVLNSLTAEAPATLSRSEDYYSYLLKITRDIAMVTLTLNVDDDITTATYRVDDGTETSVTSDTPFTVMLPPTAQTITIRLRSADIEDGIYTINIERTISVDIKIFLEGLLQ